MARASGAAGVAAEAARPAGPTARPLTPPAAAAQHTPAGATSFARWWWQAVDRAYQQLDVTAVRAYGLPACASCVQLAAGTERDRNAGARYSGGEITLQSVRVLGAGSTRIWLGTVVAQQPLRITTPTGRLVRSTHRQTTPFVLGLVWTADGWRVGVMEVQK